MLSANDNFFDPDIIDQFEIDADRARIDEASKKYVGLPNLFDIAVATCLELRREQGELDKLARGSKNKPDAERELDRRTFRVIHKRLTQVNRELMAMDIAMDSTTRAKFSDAMRTMPLPEELAF